MKNKLLLLFAFLGTNLVAMEWSKPTPLHEAVRNNDKELVQQLIVQGADVNACDPIERGNVPLYLAIDNDNVEIMELLLKAGANVDARFNLDVIFYDTPYLRNYGDTLLMRAISRMCLGGVKLLLEYGANPFIRNNAAETTFVILKNNIAFCQKYQLNASLNAYKISLDLCNDHIKKYRMLYQQLLLIQQKTSNPSPLQVIPRDMINHILWIITGLLYSQVSQFKP